MLLVTKDDKVLAIHDNQQLLNILELYPGKTIKKIREGISVISGDDDPTLTHPEYLSGVQPSDAQTALTDDDSTPEWVKTWSVEHIDEYIETNVIDLASAKEALKQIGKAIVVIRTILFSKI